MSQLPSRPYLHGEVARPFLYQGRLLSSFGGGFCAGRYELAAVLTHKGRSADSGHYVSWVKQDDGAWIQFDDDEMIPRKEEEVMALSGGGDWHMAYLLLYRAARA